MLFCFHENITKHNKLFYAYASPAKSYTFGKGLNLFLKPDDKAKKRRGVIVDLIVVTEQNRKTSAQAVIFFSTVQRASHSYFADLLPFQISSTKKQLVTMKQIYLLSNVYNKKHVSQDKRKYYSALTFV